MPDETKLTEAGALLLAPGDWRASSADARMARTRLRAYFTFGVRFRM